MGEQPRGWNNGWTGGLKHISKDGRMDLKTGGWTMECDDDDDLDQLGSSHLLERTCTRKRGILLHPTSRTTCSSLPQRLWMLSRRCCQK